MRQSRVAAKYYTECGSPNAIDWTTVAKGCAGYRHFGGRSSPEAQPLFRIAALGSARNSGPMARSITL
jgi:hypothetical protein